MNVGRFAARPMCALLLAATVTGCKTWQPVAAPAERWIAEERPASVRVTTSAGSILTLRDPWVVNDSIVAFGATPPGTASMAAPRVGVGYGDVRVLETARFSVGRTLALAAAIGGVSAAWASAVGDSEGGSREPREPLPKGLMSLSWGTLRSVMERMP